AADQVRAGDQPQDRQGARPDHPAVAAPAGGRGHSVVDRRTFLAGTGAVLLAAPLTAPAQQTIRIGFLALNLGVNPRMGDAFRQGLRDLGYVEGRNLVIEYRDAEGKPERFAALTAELVALNVDVIVAPGTLAALAAKRATATIPIVVPTIGDP